MNNSNAFKQQKFYEVEQVLLFMRDKNIEETNNELRKHILMSTIPRVSNSRRFILSHILSSFHWLFRQPWLYNPVKCFPFLELIEMIVAPFWVCVRQMGIQ